MSVTINTRTEPATTASGAQVVVPDLPIEVASGRRRGLVVAGGVVAAALAITAAGVVAHDRSGPLPTATSAVTTVSGAKVADPDSGQSGRSPRRLRDLSAPGAVAVALAGGVGFTDRGDIHRPQRDLP